MRTKTKLIILIPNHTIAGKQFSGVKYKLRFAKQFAVRDVVLKVFTFFISQP